MIGDGTVHAWNELVGRGESRRTGTARGTSAGRAADLFATRALARFVAPLRVRTAPVVVDLGPAMGGNVAFLGEQLGCKLFVEDVLSNLAVWGPVPDTEDEPDDADPDEEARRARRESVRQARAAARVLPRETSAVDGILCWDVFDFLEDDAAEALAREVTRILKPGGVLFLCHAADARCPSEATQYEIIDEVTLRYRAGPADVPKRRVWQSGAILRMFGDLAVSDSFLLTSRLREIVMRKAAAEASAE